MQDNQNPPPANNTGGDLTRLNQQPNKLRHFCIPTPEHVLKYERIKKSLHQTKMEHAAHIKEINSLQATVSTGKKYIWSDNIVNEYTKALADEQSKLPRLTKKKLLAIAEARKNGLERFIEY
jgi:hypothetical protein